MPAIDPAGEQAHWFEGLPYEGVKTSIDTGAQAHWFEGLPAPYVIPASSSAQAAGHGGMALLGVGS